MLLVFGQRAKKYSHRHNECVRFLSSCFCRKHPHTDATGIPTCSRQASGPGKKYTGTKFSGMYMHRTVAQFHFTKYSYSFQSNPQRRDIGLHASKLLNPAYIVPRLAMFLVNLHQCFYHMHMKHHSEYDFPLSILSL